MKCAKHLLRYLNGTAHYKLNYKAAGDELVGYADSSWADDIETRRSTSGILLLYNGVPVHWRSTRQNIVAHSTTEAELIALDLIARETMWFRNLLSDIGLPRSNATMIHQDNQSTIKLVENPIYHQRTKHIEVRFYAIRDWITDKKLQVRYTKTAEMLADGLTKPMGKRQLDKFVKAINLG